MVTHNVTDFSFYEKFLLNVCINLKNYTHRMGIPMYGFADIFSHTNSVYMVCVSAHLFHCRTYNICVYFCIMLNVLTKSNMMKPNSVKYMLRLTNNKLYFGFCN